MPDFRDHKTKVNIRENWCKPLIEHIHSVLGYKLIYLGLPGSDALDVISWIKYFDKIIAFQCRVWGTPSHPSQSKEKVDKLQRVLHELEEKGLIRTYSLFDGYIEEVVSNGVDNSGIPFLQKDVVTVYNLDFCNTIYFPMPKSVDDHSPRTYKMQAIRKLLEFQRDIKFIDRKKFIMFLTVNSKFLESESQKILSGLDSQLTKSYIKNLDKLNDEDKNIRLLKFYLFHVLKNHLCDCEFVPEFLPPIYYKGSGEHQMMTFTIIGTSCTQTPSASAPCFQNTKNFLKNKFLVANEKNIKSLDNANITEFPIETDPVKLFRKTYCYDNFWQRK